MNSATPFEGSEKLLEIWFRPSANEVPDARYPSLEGKTGLRKIDGKIWQGMLEIVKCQILSVISGAEMDAYLLSESSLFVAPHRLILKTCGRTLNLLGLPRILEIASTEANMPTVYRCFYSRKSFMFPEHQLGPHKDWRQEVEYLDNIFENGSAYTVGKMNGDHWLLYLTSPAFGDALSPSPVILPTEPSPDYTLEILMSDLGSAAREPFFSSLSSSDDPHIYASSLSTKIGITEIFPSINTTIDAYSFSPCGYSANALAKWNSTSKTRPSMENAGHRSENLKEGYYTIHVTPEAGWSYASFECNVPSHPSESTESVPSLRCLVERIVTIFKPGRLSLTLFISKTGSRDGIEAAQEAFKKALCHHSISLDAKRANGHAVNPNDRGDDKHYKRTDKINYEFGGYDLAFSSFELVD